MKPRAKHYVFTGTGLLIAGIFMLLLYRGLSFNPKEIPSALTGKPAQPFSVAWVQGQSHLPEAPGNPGFTLENFKNKNVILNFWASWCESCREEAKDLERIWSRYQDKGLMVVGIAIQDEKEAALKFAEFYGKSYILGLDETGQAAINYGVTGVPETFFIDKAGTLVHKVTGPVTEQEIETIIAEGVLKL